jgi:FLVCR family feline leukemia virus subgroup C receptor-related protein
MVVISAVGSFVLIAIAVGVIQTEDVLIIAINLIGAAFFLVPIIPVSIDFAGELTFPYESTVTTGFLLMSAQLLGFFIAIAVL